VYVSVIENKLSMLGMKV